MRAEKIITLTRSLEGTTSCLTLASKIVRVRAILGKGQIFCLAHLSLIADIFFINHWRVSTDLARDACPTGHVCPAGADSPVPCSSGTYNPHTGMDDLNEDCLMSPEGYYTIEASTNLTGVCAPGYYCPAGSTGPEQVRLKFKQDVGIEERGV